MNARTPMPPAPPSAIGAILVTAGRLSAEDAIRVARQQRKKNLRFGDAAMEMGLLTENDIQFALSRQFDFPCLEHGQSNVAETVFAAYEQSGPQIETLRSLRTQLMIRWFGAGPQRKALAVISVDEGDGRSLLSANLAVVFAQLGVRTLLVDANLRNPAQHALFGVSNQRGLSDMLAGRAGKDAIKRIPNLPGLSVLTAGTAAPNPQDLLLRGQFGTLLTLSAQAFDVVLFDTPPASVCSDGEATAVRVGGALMVARKNASRAPAMRKLATSIAAAGGTIVGVVVNDSR